MDLDISRCKSVDIFVDDDGDDDDDNNNNKSVTY
jgi:hypothetical protein